MFDHLNLFVQVDILVINELRHSVNALVGLLAYLSTVSIRSLHDVLDPPRHLLLHINNAFVESRNQMLHFEEALIDERLTLPRVDVLADQGIADQLKKLTDANWDVVPGLLFH